MIDNDERVNDIMSSGEEVRVCYATRAKANASSRHG